MTGTLYYGDAFDIARVGDDWAIWRICDDDGNREQIILTKDAMDELRDYFAESYSEDRGGEPSADGESVAHAEHGGRRLPEMCLDNPFGGTAICTLPKGHVGAHQWSVSSDPRFAPYPLSPLASRRATE